MTENLSEYQKFAVETAHQAGKLTLKYFQSKIKPEYKGDQTPVTIADRETEELIRDRISQRYPDHSILGEEYGHDKTQTSSHRWIIDPIDGTKAFVRGVPLYAVLLALEIDGQAEVGVAYFPALDEMISAASGLGCWWNGQKASVSEISDLNQAVVVHSDAQNFMKHGRDQAWNRVKAETYSRSGWGDAYGHLLVATGRAEIMLDPIMHVWDCGPFLPILKEAGGYFGDWEGNETIHGGEALSTNSVLMDKVLEILRE